MQDCPFERNTECDTSDRPPFIDSLPVASFFKRPRIPEILLRLIEAQKPSPTLNLVVQTFDYCIEV